MIYKMIYKIMSKFMSKIKIIKKIFCYLIIFIILLLIISIVNYFYISFYSKNFIYNNDDVNKIPYNKVAVLLGTSPNTKNGDPNIYFVNRMNATKELFDQNKIDKVIVSGDNRTVSYNETKYMRNYLENNFKISSTSIINDNAGRRTLDSILRSDMIFNQENITIISQKFHNERALYIARHNNINAIAFNAKDIDRKNFDNYFDYFYVKSRNFFREMFARNLATFDLIIKTKPEILGEEILIK